MRRTAINDPGEVVAKRPRGRPPGSGRGRGRGRGRGAPMTAAAAAVASVTGGLSLAGIGAPVQNPAMLDPMSLLAGGSDAAAAEARGAAMQSGLAGAAGLSGAGAAADGSGGPGAEDEGDDDDDDADEQLYQGPMTTEEDREAIRALLDTFDEEQLHRYEAYRRAHLPKAAVRKMVQTIVGGIVPASIGIVVGGCAKLFVGDIVEGALEYMEELGEPASTAIRPEHLRESFRRYREQHPHSMRSRLHRSSRF
ncbi:hTAFII28-like protein conserved region-domain-containing protein [Entophlyctis helioformis]|nr:hTAFII28-like protein conserved region-domain-containing protein [Entophlyctis helioformis]